ncbi:phosphatidate cytidylyltransferase [Caulobacter vibrioides]|uniref:phosphatidate cytidylyltransferase n=1 Tax=Caulobacter vibrioides TaxID=155892 RepID=UPI000BB4CC37|nr:phosphatidate cytidylyltransferase [Caulobacter vibrioides]ATC24883.1 phosphatidate cytidylyltransferase [Caulobacter vibrioides]AZH13039.1 phosphatidate cytidylyltransferase [Caulobacter vibrioides]PLR09661.1 phosphatidate cytidylyltransferase [Caulobacter vibrioides]
MEGSLPMTSPSPAKRFNWGNLRTRVVSATVLVPTVVAAIWLGGYWFMALSLVCVGLLAREWGRISAPKAPNAVGAVVGVFCGIAVVAAFLQQFLVAWAVVLVGSFLAGLIARGAVERRADAAYGVVYIAPAVIAMVWVRSLDDGLWWTLLLFVVTWFADIFAYVTGSILKGPKLWPRISPNKTWAGFVGGLAAATIGAVVVASLAKLDLIWQAAALIGLLGGLATMAGDLWESMLKRRFGVKDSGDLIPGHGGLLDRVDGLMFAAIVIAAVRLVDQIGWGH